MFAGAASAATVQSNQITTAKNTVGTNTGQTIQQKSKINDPVNLRTLKSYSTIQAAINDPKTLNGDTIVVFSGVYTENVKVNKALILLAKGTVTVQAADSSQPVFNITSNKVTIQNFIIGPTKSDGIWVQSNSNTIRDNTITNTDNGIQLQNARSNNIKNNNINNNGNDGIDLENSNSNFLTSNTVSNNGINGIFLDTSNFNTIANNYATNDPLNAIEIDYSNFNTINGNTFSSTGGIYLLYSDRNAITNNIVTDTLGGFSGIELDFSNNNAIIGNTVTGSDDDGVLLETSSNNNINGNNLTANTGYGVDLITASNSNTITNNDLTLNTAGDRFVDGTSLNNFFSGNNPIP